MNGLVARWGHVTVACGVLACTLAALPVAAQEKPAAASTLTVAGEVKTPLTLAPGDLKGMPRTRVEVKSEDGRVVIFEGVLVGEILRRAGAPLGAELRGNALTTYVMASARDGYQVVFSLAELDPALTGSSVVLADTIDGKPLLDSQGPLRIVVPKDARPSRGVRMLERLDVVAVRK